MIEVMGRRGRRCEQLLGDVKEERRYCKWKGETIDRAVWRTGFGRVCEPVVRQNTELMTARSGAAVVRVQT